MPHTPLMLMILDGWGIRETKQDNAIALANTPNYDRLMKMAVLASSYLQSKNRPFSIDKSLSGCATVSASATTKMVI